VAFGRKAAPKAIKTAVVTSKKTAAGTSRAGLGTVIGSILATPYRHYDTGTLAELDLAIKRIAADRPDIFAFTGGDGAVHVIVTRLIREYQALGIELPYLAYIPIGTMMNIGRSLDLDRVSAVNLAKLFGEKIDMQRRGEYAPFAVTPIQPIKVNEEYGFIYGSGLPVNFLQEYERAVHHCEDREHCGFRCKWVHAMRAKGVCPKCGRKLVREALGPWRAIKVILGSLISKKKRRQLMRPVHAKVSLPDGHDPPVAPFMTHTALMVATVDQLGMGMRGMPEARSRPNHFMLRSTQLKYWQLAFPTTLGALWAGLPLPKTFDAVVPSLVIEYEEPTVATLDGDMLQPATRHELSYGPMLRFITG
jgi:hypothetical protein